jgi:hypothetical protein
MSQDEGDLYSSKYRSDEMYLKFRGENGHPMIKMRRVVLR